MCRYINFLFRCWLCTSISWHVGCYPGQLTGDSAKTKLFIFILIQTLPTWHTHQGHQSVHNLFPMRQHQSGKSKGCSKSADISIKFNHFVICRYLKCDKRPPTVPLACVLAISPSADHVVCDVTWVVHGPSIGACSIGPENQLYWFVKMTLMIVTWWWPRPLGGRRGSCPRWTWSPTQR